MQTTEVCVIGAGPAGAVAALRAAQLGAKTSLVSSGEFGGMAANDGPVPVRTLAHAARLLRDARQLGRYGIEVSDEEQGERDHHAYVADPFGNRIELIEPL